MQDLLTAPGVETKLIVKATASTITATPVSDLDKTLTLTPNESALRWTPVLHPESTFLQCESFKKSRNKQYTNLSTALVNCRFNDRSNNRQILTAFKFRTGCFTKAECSVLSVLQVLSAHTQTQGKFQQIELQSAVMACPYISISPSLDNIQIVSQSSNQQMIIVFQTTDNQVLCWTQPSFIMQHSITQVFSTCLLLLLLLLFM